MKKEKGKIVSDVSMLERRASSSLTAKRLVRKRYLKTGNDGVDRYQMDGTNVVYRNQGTPYINCAFLDDGDTIIAANEQGYIDIVRLPRYDGTSTFPTRPLGRALCTDLSLNLDRSRTTPRCRKIHGFHSGEAFAVGLDSGEFQIFSTERSTPWWVSKQKQLGLVKTHSKPFQDLITHAYKIGAPRRKYHSDETISLAAQIRSPTFVESQLEEMYEWTMGYGGRHPCTWDFREIASGSLQAIHIEAYGDNFCFRMLDSRSPQSHHSICIDLNMTNNDSISALCFLSDHSVATASSFDVKSRDGKIEIWDLRMIRKESKSHLSLFVPTFPEDVAYGFDKEECVHMNISTSRDLTLPENSKVIFSDLKLLRNGYLIASCASLPIYFVIDPIRIKIVTVVHTGDTKDLSAIDRQNGLIASYSLHHHDIGGSLRFYDSTRSSKAAIAGKKRKVESASGDSKNQDENENFDFKIEVDLQDRNGLETILSHMSFNDLGSSLIATSQDGDIFLWRAS